MGGHVACMGVMRNPSMKLTFSVIP